MDMTSQLKCLRILTILRTRINPEKVDGKRYDELLSDDNIALNRLVVNIEALLSGAIDFNIDKKEITFNGEVFVLE